MTCLFEPPKPKTKHKLDDTSFSSELAFQQDGNIYMKIHFKRKGKILEVLNPEILSQAPFKIVEVLTLILFSSLDC